MNLLVEREVLITSYERIRDPAWVVDNSGAIAGHLYAALLEDRSGLAAWTGPDGATFDDTHALAALVDEGTRTWRTRGVREHSVWCLNDPARVASWNTVGYEVAAVRGALRLSTSLRRALPVGYTLRGATPADFERALDLDAIIDAAQGTDVRHLSARERREDREELLDTLSDDQTQHYVVEHEGLVIAQCVTFPAPSRRGSFDATVHISEVAVEPSHQRRGVANAMLDVAMDDAFAQGFVYAEAQWRSVNLAAAAYWTQRGFQPTYVRLHRTLD